MVNVTYFDGFSNFLAQLLLQPNASLILGGETPTLLIKTNHSTQPRFPPTGRTNAEIECSLGKLMLSGLPFSTPLVLEGMNSFRDPPIGILSTDISGGFPGGLALSLTLSIYNPSITAAQLGLIGNLT